MNKHYFYDEMESYLTSVQYNLKALKPKFSMWFNYVAKDLKSSLKYASELQLRRFMENMNSSTYNNTTFFINLLVFVRALKYQGDNIDNLDAIVDDISGLDIEIDNLEEIPLGYIEAGMFEEIIDFIISNKKYKDNLSLRKYLVTFLKELKTPSSCRDLYVQSIDRANRLTSSELRRLGGKKIASYIILGEFFDKYTFNNVLCYEDRYFFVNKKLLDLEKNHLFRSQILYFISNLDRGLFDHLNKDSDRDVFIRYMDIIFDSDSYTELCSKLNYLKEICELFLAGNNIDGEMVLNDLLSRVHKEIYLGQEVSYPDKKTMNYISKPKTIVGRMEELYSKINGDRWSLDDMYYMSISIGDFNFEVASLKEYKAKIKKR